MHVYVVQVEDVGAEDDMAAPERREGGKPGGRKGGRERWGFHCIWKFVFFLIHE